MVTCNPLGAAAAAAMLLGHAAGAADLRFPHAPPQWQTAICLPDDPCKSLVDDQGALLYHYGKGGNGFGVKVTVEVAGDARRDHQQLLEPRVPLVQTRQSAEGWEITQEAFALTAKAADPARRGDVIVVHVRNTSERERSVAPRVIVDTRLPVGFDGRRVMIHGRDEIRASLPVARWVEEGRSRRVLILEPLTVPAGGGQRFFVGYNGGAERPDDVAAAWRARDAAVTWWRRLALPYGRVEVPDARVQALLDASVRNIWQAREIKNGLAAFQVGPSSYRGLWIIDGAFMLETAAMLGAVDEARSGVAYELGYQKPDGRIEVLNDFSKENGIVLWTCARHARLTQDKRWLESIWPKLQRTAAHIRALRQQTLTNDTPLDDGLNPPGMPDGGIGGVFPEYTNPLWNLIGLKSFADAADWLGRHDEAAQWRREFDSFMAAFRRAAARDLRQDAHGNRYLPALMGEAAADVLPQRSQWGFCHAVYPGGLFERDDPMVAGTLAMLAATETQGMVRGTGWHESGVWTYFASFYGHAWLWQGHGGKAAASLQAFADHAAPVLVWREEQSLTGQAPRHVGDMPHNWAAAEFIRLVVHLLALDRGDELHLLEGLPRQWMQPGMKTKLTAIATPFGPLTMEVLVAADGASASLALEPLSGGGCARIIVHPGPWAPAGMKVLEADPARRQVLTLPLAR